PCSPSSAPEVSLLAPASFLTPSERSVGRVGVPARARVLIEAVSPQVDAGRYPVKRILGDRVTTSCDLVRDGHDAVAGDLLYRGPSTSEWRREPLQPCEND